MSIETIGGMKKILGNHAAGPWTKEVDLKSVVPEAFELNGTKKSSFLEMLSESVAQVNGLQQEANVAIEKLVTGESKNLQETMIAVEKADIAFKTINQIRLKVIDAYKEIMKMQV
ncbi:MAG: flagellar hook-basal body complex protein FliE [Bdellovibrio sp.]|nr:flagellar hook-basal body complex protein FliE [Bdellovibrio sp.]